MFRVPGQNELLVAEPTLPPSAVVCSVFFLVRNAGQKRIYENYSVGTPVQFSNRCGSKSICGLFHPRARVTFLPLVSFDCCNQERETATTKPSAELGRALPPSQFSPEGIENKGLYCRLSVSYIMIVLTLPCITHDLLSLASGPYSYCSSA